MSQELKSRKSLAKKLGPEAFELYNELSRVGIIIGMTYDETLKLKGKQKVKFQEILEIVREYNGKVQAFLRKIPYDPRNP